MKINKTALLISLALICSSATAGEKEDLEILRQTTINLIQLLVQQGVLTQDKANALVQAAEKSAAEKVAAREKSDAKPDAKIVRVPYVPQIVRNEIKDELRQELLAQAKSERWGEPGALPSWLSRISLYGDLRVRHEKDYFASDNDIPVNFPGQNINNTQSQRAQFRLRARLGVKAKITDWVSGGLRLATGSATNPVSTNQTLGNFNNKNAILVDQAYIKLDPYNWLSLSGGKIPNPFFGTDLVWDPDLNFDGVAATLKPRFTDATNGYFVAGIFPVQEIAPTPLTLAQNKWLYGYQGGIEWASPNNSKAKIGVGLYRYSHVEGIPNTGVAGSPEAHRYDATAPLFSQKGNSLFDIAVAGDPTQYALLSKFKELNLTASYDLASFDPVHVVLTGDFVKNIGFDRNEILARTGVQDYVPKTKGYTASVTVGMTNMEKLGDWQVFGAYKYLERDAVLDAYTDSDFHLGGTNAKGYILGGSYGLDKNTWLSLRWLSANQIDGLYTGQKLGIDVLQLDLNAKF